MPLLQAVADALDDIGLPSLTSIVGNIDPTARAVLRYANKTGNDLAEKDPGWVILMREYVFNTVDQQENYPLPADYGRMIDSTVWDRNNYWQVRGSLTPQAWQVIKSGLVQTARISSNFRFKRSPTGFDKEFYIDPLPPEGLPLVYEYLSNEWVVSADGNTGRTRYAADDDETVFGDDIITLGIIWRWKRARGLPYQSDLQEFVESVSRKSGWDTAPPVLNLTETYWRLPSGNVPDTGFGSP